MAQLRSTINVPTSVKRQIEWIKNKLGCKTESQALAYMTALFIDSYDKTTIKQHEQLKSKANDIHNQTNL